LLTINRHIKINNGNGDASYNRQHSPLNIPILTEVIETLERELERKGVSLDPARKAQFIAIVYQRHAGKATPANDTRGMLELLETEKGET